MIEGTPPPTPEPAAPPPASRKNFDEYAAHFTRAAGLLMVLFLALGILWVVAVLGNHSDAGAPILEMMKAVVYGGVGLAGGIAVTRR